MDSAPASTPPRSRADGLVSCTVAPGILVQEPRKNRFDLHWGGCDFQHPGVATSEQLCLLAE
jgi:hypothetical protein